MAHRLDSVWTIRNKEIKNRMVQGGMGVRISGYNLAGAVAAHGGIGTLSGACLRHCVSKEMGEKLDDRQAARVETEKARKICGHDGYLAMNCLYAARSSLIGSLLGAMDGGIDALVVGAGLPTGLPEMIAGHERAGEVALIPIVSSPRALEIICRRWSKQKRLPDAVICEGPRAGGHLGFKEEELNNPESNLEILLPQIIKVAQAYGNIPVIAAGGLFTREDCEKTIECGAAAVQLANRFLVAKESGASPQYKQATIACEPGDIAVAVMPKCGDENNENFVPASPCGLPFRVLLNSPFIKAMQRGEYRTVCDKGYLLHEGKCLAKDEPGRYLCLCNGLTASCLCNPEAPQLFTASANAWRIKEETTVAKLMDELIHG